MKKLLWCFFLLILVLSAGAYEPLDSLSVSDRDKANTVTDLIDSARSKIWMSKTTSLQIESVLARAAALASGIGDVAARDYLLAWVELNRARLAIVHKAPKKELFSALEEAIRLAKSSVEARESSEGLRVLASSSSIWMVNKGLFAILGTAGKVFEWSERAMELDPQNALAELVDVQSLIQAPKGSRGDPEKAQRRLLRLHSRSDLDNIERFWTRTSLANAYAKLKNREEGRRWCLSAAEIFPDNILVEECRKELKIRS